MNKDAKQFLFDLLSTPSPSGNEWAIQERWMEYVQPYADQIDTDTIGNAIATLNPDASFKILLAGHCDEIGFMINHIEDNGFLRFQKVGGISHKIAPGMKVRILGYKQQIVGVVGANAEHHGGLKDGFSFEDLYIDCGAKDKKEIAAYVQIGDLAVYERETEELLNDRISGRGLDNRTGAFIVAEVLRRLATSRKKTKVGVYSVSTISEEIGLHGAYFAGAGIQPDAAIACDVTFATDYPGVNKSKYGDVKVGGGPVLAKGSPIHPVLNTLLEKAAKRKKYALQYELTPAGTGTDADRIRFTGKGVPVALVSLPLRYMHSPVEVVSLQDIEQEIELLVELIQQLDGKEDLRPVLPPTNKANKRANKSNKRANKSSKSKKRTTSK